MQADLLQSQNLNGTQVTETLCDLLQRKAGQDERRTCTGEEETGPGFIRSCVSCEDGSVRSSAYL